MYKSYCPGKSKEQSFSSYAYLMTWNSKKRNTHRNIDIRITQVNRPFFIPAWGCSLNFYTHLAVHLRLLISSICFMHFLPPLFGEVDFSFSFSFLFFLEHLRIFRLQIRMCVFTCAVFFSSSFLELFTWEEWKREESKSSSSKKFVFFVLTRTRNEFQETFVTCQGLQVDIWVKRANTGTCYLWVKYWKLKKLHSRRHTYKGSFCEIPLNCF